MNNTEDDDDLPDFLDRLIHRAEICLNELPSLLENPQERFRCMEKIQYFKNEVTRLVKLQIAGSGDALFQAEVNRAITLSNEVITQLTAILNQTTLEEHRKENEKLPLAYADGKYVVTLATLMEFEAIGTLLRKLCLQFESLYTPEAFQITGERLKVFNGEALLLDTQHEMSMFIDILLFFHCPHGDKVLIREFYEANKNQFLGEERILLDHFIETRFTILEIVRPFGRAGLIVYDPLTQKEHLMIHPTLGDVAREPIKQRILTQYFVEPNSKFIMTTGAATPLPHAHPATTRIMTIFKRLLDNRDLPQDEYFQAVYDMYGICINEDLTRFVLSKPVPFGQGEQASIRVVH